MLLEVQNVTLGYEGNAVVSGLDFVVNKGDYLCILGQNGSGKTTLMKAMLGFLQPMDGKILRHMPPNAIGYLPQQQQGQQDFPASVWEVVLSGCQSGRRFLPFYSRSERELAQKNMELMNISHLASHSFRVLSGGQRQRVLLARSLCAAKQMLLLDEPVTGLDPEVTEELYSLVSKINREQNMTVVMISHDVAKASEYASHILHLDHRMLYFGSAAAYNRDAVIQKGMSK